MLRQEALHVADGAPPRDLSEYTDWRFDAHPDNLRAIGIYSDLLVGQFAGMTEALSLEAVRAAMDILGVDRRERPALARRLIRLHGLVMEFKRAEKGDA
jgi:hypothetical protein